MSYDLNFWRYKAGVILDHQHVYERLSDGEILEGLEELPSEAMLARLSQIFTDWEQVNSMTFDGGSRGSFQAFVTPQLFRVDCYGMDGEDMNKFIDLGAAFGCPLYDPQEGRRFDLG